MWSIIRPRKDSIWASFLLGIHISCIETCSRTNRLKLLKMLKCKWSQTGRSRMPRLTLTWKLVSIQDTSIKMGRRRTALAGLLVRTMMTSICSNRRATWPLCSTRWWDVLRPILGPSEISIIASWSTRTPKMRLCARASRNEKIPPSTTASFRTRPTSKFKISFVGSRIQGELAITQTSMTRTRSRQKTAAQNHGRRLTRRHMFNTSTSRRNRTRPSHQYQQQMRSRPTKPRHLVAAQGLFRLATSWLHKASRTLRGTSRAQVARPAMWPSAWLPRLRNRLLIWSIRKIQRSQSKTPEPKVLCTGRWVARAKNNLNITNSRLDYRGHETAKAVAVSV